MKLHEWMKAKEAAFTEEAHGPLQDWRKMVVMDRPNEADVQTFSLTVLEKTTKAAIARVCHLLNVEQSAPEDLSEFFLP